MKDFCLYYSLGVSASMQISEVNVCQRRYFHLFFFNLRLPTVIFSTEIELLRFML